MIRKKQLLGLTRETLNNKSLPGITISRLEVICVGLVLVAMTFFAGYLYDKVNTLEKSPPKASVQTQAQPQPQAKQPAPPQISLDTIKGLFTKDVIKFGKGDKKLVMVYVADPSCTYCHVVGGANTEIGAQMGPQFKLVSQGGTYVPPVPEMKKLVDQGKADFVWIYTPGSRNGKMATKALCFAFDKGKFWQVHDLLMSPKGYDLINNQIKDDSSKSQQMADFLASVINSKQMKNALDGGKYDARLNDETALASTLGVSGTPGFFLNSTNFAGAYSWTDMKSVADAAL